MTLTIHIDLDRKCRRCHRGGAMDNGLCMKCVTKGIVRGDYDHVLKPLKKNLSKQLVLPDKGEPK